MDPLSDVLSLLKPRSYMAGAIDIGGDWSTRFPAHEGVKCYAMVHGQGWLAVDGVAEPVLIEAGDCLLLPRGRPFTLTSDLSLRPKPIDLQAVQSNPLNGGIRIHNGGGDRMVVGGHFAFAGGHAGLLLEMLPPIVHLRSDPDRAVLRWCMERMMQELRVPQPGSDLVGQHLAHLMLIQALRLHLERGPRGVGWLFALADRQMRAAIGAMHEDPAQRWTLEALARQAGMSRTSFTVAFKSKVGMPPMAYLTRWRMMLAGDRLAGTDEPVAAIALSLGYESESAFSTAFKRVMGCAPRRYGRGRTETAGAAA